MHTAGPYSGILAYLVKVVALTTPTHVANIANEWLPIQTYGDAYFAISLIRKCQSKFHNVKLLDTVHSACGYKKFGLNTFPDA